MVLRLKALLLVAAGSVEAFVVSPAATRPTATHHPSISWMTNEPAVTHIFLHNDNKHRSDLTSSSYDTSRSAFSNTLAASLLCATAWLTCPAFAPAPAHAAADVAPSRVVGQIAGSGLVMKDILEVESFQDPKVRGVTLYVSNFQRPITERLSSAKNFFSDPSSSAVACVKISPTIELADTINKTPQGEEVFKESKSLLFKSLRVQRIYDEATQTLVYVSFNTRLDKSDDTNKSRFQNSLCAIHID